MAERRITNIVIDFGGVIAPASMEQVKSRFREIGVKNIEEYLDVITQRGFIGDFESGTIGTEEFISKISEIAGQEVSHERCAYACQGFFLPIPQRNLDILTRLRSEGYALSLLSNTNPLVAEWTLSNSFDGKGHPLSHYFDRIYLSYAIKAMKPDPKAFMNMLEGEGVEPERILFIDDGERNIEAASKLGINTLKVTNGEDWTILVAPRLNELNGCGDQEGTGR